MKPLCRADALAREAADLLADAMELVAEQQLKACGDTSTAEKCRNLQSRYAALIAAGDE